eukprot:COSAG03_NODE_394_length_8267_cov_48.943315_4_plen_104_part_00
MCRDGRAAETQVSGEFQWPQGGVGQPAPRARGARELGRPRSSASGSHVLVTRCVWWLPDHEFTLSLPETDGGLRGGSVCSVGVAARIVLRLVCSTSSATAHGP